MSKYWREHTYIYVVVATKIFNVKHIENIDDDTKIPEGIPEAKSRASDW